MAQALAPCRGRVAFASGRRAAAVPRVANRPARRTAVCVRARLEWPDPQLIAACKAEFPDKGVANAEEGRALISNLGYTYLDVRPALECEEVGKVKQSINVPVVNMKKVFDSATRTNKYIKSPNPDFVAQLEKKVPNKNTPLMVGCSDGKTYSIDALELMEEAGYTTLALLKGGYYSWFRTWDNKLNRRRLGEYAENPYGEGADSCGIHASGAGFDKVDKIESWIPRKF